MNNQGILPRWSTSNVWFAPCPVMFPINSISYPFDKAPFLPYTSFHPNSGKQSCTMKVHVGLCHPLYLQGNCFVYFHRTLKVRDLHQVFQHDQGGPNHVAKNTSGWLPPITANNEVLFTNRSTDPSTYGVLPSLDTRAEARGRPEDREGFVQGLLRDAVDGTWTSASCEARVLVGVKRSRRTLFFCWFHRKSITTGEKHIFFQGT